MGITINTDLYLLCSMFNISMKKLSNEYSGMTVEQIMQKEAEQGNTAAARFDSAVLSDPVKLIELFELNDPGNKYAILNNMNQDDLDNLLPLLNDKDLIQGLQFFNKDKLLNLMGNLPQEQILNLTLNMFSQEHLMQLLPDEQINNVLMSNDIDKDMEMQYIKTLPPQIMALMLESATGQSVMDSSNANMDGTYNLDAKNLYNQLTVLPDDKFQEAMLSIPPQTKRDFVLKLTKENPKLYQSINPQALLGVIDEKKDKQDIIRYANVIKTDNLVKMVQQLPKELTAVVLTQLDTNIFANKLLSGFKNILSQIIAG